MAYYKIHKFASDRYNVNDHIFYLSQKPLTQRWKRGFEAAKEASLSSDGKTIGTRMGAAVFSSGRLLATGYNLYAKTRPGNSHRKENGKIYDTSTHAEQMCIDQIKHYDYSNIKLIIYVVRLDIDGNYVTSRPCNVCIEMLKKHGVKIARFINANGIPEEMVII